MAAPFSWPSEYSSPVLPTSHDSASRSELSITAFARFEFEPGKGNEGTKILMVEWQDDDNNNGRDATGSWHISWESKKAVLPADEQMNDRTRRMYFMLGPGITIPPVVTLTYEPAPESARTVKQPTSLRLNPLPAIFPPELVDTGRMAGKKGVLHTIWAKKRLQSLEKEIEAEKQYNLEGIALEMAIQEKEWIEANFGVGSAKLPNSLTSGQIYPTGPLSPASPKSPSMKLSEKLRGLKIGTGEKDLMTRPEASSLTDCDAHPLSPDSPDVAISSFASFRNTPISASSSHSLLTSAKPVAHDPPQFIKDMQAQQQGKGIASLNAITRVSAQEKEDDLFAKALSPRTPDIPRSPFSFAPHKQVTF